MKTLCLVDSLHLIESQKSLINSKRKNVDQFHNNCYKSVLELAKKVKVDQIKFHTAAIQRNHYIIPSESVPDYFKKLVTMPLLDYLTTQLNERFDSACYSIQWFGYYSLKIDFYGS